MTERKQLKIKEVERLENTSFASVFAAGLADTMNAKWADTVGCVSDEGTCGCASEIGSCVCSGCCEASACCSTSVAVCCSVATCNAEVVNARATDVFLS